MVPSTFLTSWKDIAQYVGKSVRTAQRWEHELGLPVRRPEKANSKNTVLIETRELDRWIRSTFNNLAEIRPPQMNWELLERSKQLIAEASVVRKEHSLLVQQSQHVRLELGKSHLTYASPTILRQESH